jgi:hypothetical protein
MDESSIRAAEARVDAVRDLDMRWEEDAGGRPRVVGRLGDRPVVIEVRRDHNPAAAAEVEFVAGALADLRRLLGAVRSGERLSPEEIFSMESRVQATSPGPWTAFIESDGGQAGCDVIRISERDDQPDMYLWIGSDLAPSRLFRLVAGARQDIPALLALVR